MGEFFLAEDEGAFLLLEKANFFLDAVFHDEAVGEDGLLLADAVGAVDGLGFDGGVPTRVKQDNVAGGGEIEELPAVFLNLRLNDGEHFEELGED